jgi:hypothetical protein
MRQWEEAVGRGRMDEATGSPERPVAAMPPQ